MNFKIEEKMKKSNLFVSFAILALFASCAEDSFDVDNPRHIIITAELPDDEVTRAYLTQKDGSLDMLAQLSEDDKVSLLVEQDGLIYENRSSDFFGRYPLTSLSENKKSCTFEFDLREEIDPNRPYTLYGALGMSVVAGKYDDGKGVGIAWGGLSRGSGLDFLPLYFVMPSGTPTNHVKFKHITAYEIVHITNTDSKAVNFHYGGFEADDAWYYLCYSVMFPDCTVEGNDNYIGNGYTSEKTINPGETIDFMTCYVPTGKKMSNARLRAMVNGEEITSTNTKSSDVEIKAGNAYHMYATWDGNELKFGKNENVVLPSKGLVAYYPFNGNANDASGFENHGTLSSGSVTLTTGVDGDADGAYMFGGISKPGHIRVKNSESLKFTDGCTFAAYIKPTSWRSMDGYGYTVNTRGGECFMAKDHDMNGVTFMVSGNDEKCSVYMQSWNNREPWAKASSGDKLTGNYLNRWTHVAFVYGNGRARLYVDGELMCDNESTPNFSKVNGRDFYIGKYSDSWYPFNGAIDEVRIYDRPLSGSEVRALVRYGQSTDGGMPIPDSEVIGDGSGDGPIA